MIHGQVMQPPVEAGHLDVKQASSVGKIVNFKGEKPRTLCSNFRISFRNGRKCSSDENSRELGTGPFSVDSHVGHQDPPAVSRIPSTGIQREFIPNRGWTVIDPTKKDPLFTQDRSEEFILKQMIIEL